MTVNELLDALAARGVELFVSGEQLRYRAPAGALTPELKQAVADHRGELLARLGDAAHPLSSAQQRMWFLDRLVPDDPSYNAAFALDLRGTFDREAFEASLSHMVERHAALRTRFVEQAAGPVQIVMPPEPVPWERFDLTPLPVVERRAAALRMVSEHARRPFDLSAGRLVR